MDMRLILDLPMPAQPPKPAPTLTERDLATLHAIAEGLTYLQMARRLGISRQGVSQRCNRLYTKLGVRSRLHAVIWAIQQGHLNPAEIAIDHIER